MLADGIYVMLNGKYIGPPKPGPWAGLFAKRGIDVFKLGPVFIIYGIVWLTFLTGVWMQQPWAYPLGIVASILTLWYLPVGTLVSLGILAMLLFERAELGV